MNETQFDLKLNPPPRASVAVLVAALLLIVVTRLGANRSVAPLVCSRRFCLIFRREVAADSTIRFDPLRAARRGLLRLAVRTVVLRKNCMTDRQAVFSSQYWW
jgi:hypothetical protein